jgi:hypothetical protein
MESHRAESWSALGSARIASKAVELQFKSRVAISLDWLKGEKRAKEKRRNVEMF